MLRPAPRSAASMSRNSSISVSLLARGRRPIRSSARRLEQLVGRDRHGDLARLRLDEVRQRRTARRRRGRPEARTTSRNRNKARHFRARKTAARIRQAFTCQGGGLMPPSGFGYKYEHVGCRRRITAHKASRRSRRRCSAAALGPPLGRAGRHDGRRQVVDRPPARRPARHPVRRCRHRDREGRRHDHPGDFRRPWRAVFPRRRGARHRAAAGGRPAGAGDRRRRLHERRDPRADPRQGHFGLAAGRRSKSSTGGSSGAATGRCSRTPIRRRRCGG